MNVITVQKKGNEKNYNDLRFVLRAVSKDDTRPVLMVVCSTGKRIIATDGFRLHMVKNNTVPEGYYKAVNNNAKEIVLVEQAKEEYGSYPNVRNAIPTRVKKIYESISRFGKDNHYIAFSEIVRKLPEGQALNFDFLKDITDSMESFVVRKPGAYGALYFKNCNKSALVMPIRL